MDRISCEFEYKFAAGGAEGSFEGYAATFNGIDQGEDRILHGAFAGVIQKAAVDLRMPKMLLQHAGLPYAPPLPEDMIPIGKWMGWKEDTRGLEVSGRLINLDTDSGRRIYGAMKEGELDALSIGYKVGDFKRGAKSGEPRRTISTMEKVPEISLVTFPMDERALVRGVKSAVDYTTQDWREIEGSLRDAGLSRADAVKAVSRRMPLSFRPWRAC